MVYMSKKKEKIDLNNLAPEEELKYEIAKELGLLDKVMEQGWKALTAKETGRNQSFLHNLRLQLRSHLNDDRLLRI